MELAKGNLFKKTKNETYFVQCYEESEDDWKICGNQTVFENSTIHMERLQPYTKYKVIQDPLVFWQFIHSKSVLVSRCFVAIGERSDLL